MEKIELAIMLGLDCTAQCSHCAVDSTPASVIKIRTNEIESIVSGFAKIKDNISSIVFTGGEPTLHLEDIAKILNKLLVNLNDISVVLITNGYFASDDESCSLLKKIPKLDEISLSYDNFHKPFVSSDNIYYLAKYCKKNGIKFRGSVVLGSPLDYQYVELFHSLNVECTLRVLQFIGRGKNLSNDQFKRNHSIPWDQRCSCRNSILFVPGRGFTWCAKNLVWNTKLYDINIFSKSIEDLHNMVFYKNICTKTFREMKNMFSSRKLFYTECDVCEEYTRWLQK